MTEFRVRILPRAKQDLDQIVGWVHERSPEGTGAVGDCF